MEEIHYLLGNSCNLGCKFCFWDMRMPPVDITESKKIIDEITKTGITRITISGGEPTCTPTFKKLIDYIYQSGLEIILHTNALLIDKALANFLSQRVTRVSLSLDGSNETIAKMMRGSELSFQKTVEAIDMFSSLNTAINVKTLVTRINKDDIIKIGILLTDKDIEYWTLLEFNPINRGKLHKKSFYISDKAFDTIATNAKIQFPSIEIRTRLFKRKSKKYCFIAADGKVYTFVPDKGNVLVGDLFKVPLVNLLKNI